MASFKFYLRDAKSLTTSAIQLVFDDSINRVKLSIQESIKPGDWNSKTQTAKKSLTGFSEFNRKLKTIKDKAIDLHYTQTTNGDFTREKFKAAFDAYINQLNGKDVASNASALTFKSLAEFAEFSLEKANITRKKVTLVRYRQTIKMLREFEGKRRFVTFENFNYDLFCEIVNYMKRVKGLKPNTIVRQIKTLKMFMQDAFDKGLHTNLEFKRRSFMIKGETPDTIYLTEAEIDKIYQFDFSENKRLDKVRDLFIIGCHTGLRFSDFSRLKLQNVNDRTITIRTQKTNQSLTIPVSEVVKEILAKYEAKGGLPSISNQKMNEYLKEIGEQVGINDPTPVNTTKGDLQTQTFKPKYELISTHTARRSFATNEYLNKTPTLAIRAITGHKTEAAFLRYIRVTGEQQAKVVLQYWDERNKLRVS
jgi:integrase